MRIRMSISLGAMILATATAAAAQPMEFFARILSSDSAPYSRGVFDPERDTTRAALRSFLLSESSANSFSSQVLTFYADRQFEPAWSESASQQKNAEELRAVLARADEQGLSDTDYQLPNARGLSAGRSAVEYEVAFTAAVLRYVRDVHSGRVKPGDVDEDIALPAMRFEPATELNRALKNRSLTTFLAKLPPPHPAYRRLMDALAHYRALAESKSWPTVPASKSQTKIDAKDGRLPLLIKRLAAEDASMAALRHPSTDDIRDALKLFQRRNGLETDGRLSPETLAALNESPSARAARIAANMERWRWVPRTFERRYIAVNVPDESVSYVRNGEIILSSKVIIGRKANATPITRAEITGIIANPPWNIPGFIAARDLLPHLRKNANYLANKNMVLMNGPPGDPTGRSINWRNVSAKNFPYAIRQLAGPSAALGVLMLDSPNEFDVYLHDTPAKALFDASSREFSNGCVRVQDIFPLASLALTGDSDAGLARIKRATQSRETRRLALNEPLPVYFLYWTALAGPNGEIEFRPDRYGRDKKLIAAMNLKANATLISAALPSRRRAAGPEDLSP